MKTSRILTKNMLNSLLYPCLPKFSDHENSNSFMVLNPTNNILFNILLLIKGRNNRLEINLFNTFLPHNLLLYITLPFQYAIIISIHTTVLNNKKKLFILLI